MIASDDATSLFQVLATSVQGCGKGRAHSTCFVLLTSGDAHVCEAVTSELADLVCRHVGT